MSGRKIAVLTARADDRAQKDIICGIAEAAFAADTDVVVFSNIYNHWAEDELLCFENIVYEAFDPAGFDGVIITAEAFSELSVIEGAIKKIRKSGIPAVSVNGEIDGFENIYCDDEGDMEKICSHLMNAHNITDINILTGPKDSVFAQRRLSGCRKAFEKQGIPFDESKVFYGNFWYDSGYFLAHRYISGELPLPQAVVCGNDCMAYQLCDELSAAGIRIPEDVAVTGYDCTGGRIYHHPVLTTYRSGRREAGIRAAAFLLKTDYAAEESDRFMSGNTCPCGIKSSEFNIEVKNEHTEHPGTFVDNSIQFSTAQFLQELTLCRTLVDYLKVINGYSLLHEADSLIFCLDKEWNSGEYVGDEYLCFVMDGEENMREPSLLAENKLSEFITEISGRPSVYYFCPLCFQTRLYGYTVLSYKAPERFRYQIRSWNRNISNALELLRLKNDIHYLTLCQRTSSLYDALTGFYRAAEFRRIAAEASDRKMSMAAVKISLYSDKDYLCDSSCKNDIISSAALAIKQVCTNHEIFCRTDSDVFIILCREDGENVSERLKVILHRDIYVRYYDKFPMISFAVCSGCSADDIDKITEAAEKGEETDMPYRNRENILQYEKLIELRRDIISSPRSAPDIDSASRRLCVSKGYFRAIYRKCFGISYVQDCINEKIMLAKYLLCTSVMSIYAVALQCGYSDEKYFARQFHQSTGCSPVRYRKKYCGSALS